MKATFRSALYRLAFGAVRMLGGKARKKYALGILKLDRLGDGVLALGAVRRLMEEVREEELLLVVSDVAAPLFRAEFPKVEMLVLPAFSRKFAPDYIAFIVRHAWMLSAVQVERLACLRHQPSDYLATVAGLLRPHRCVASTVARPWEPVCLKYPKGARAVYPEETNGTCLEIEAHRRVVELMLGRPVALAEVMPVITCAALKEGRALMLCPDAGDGIRIYPPQQYAEAIRLLLTQHDLPVEICLPPGADDSSLRAALSVAGVTCRVWHRPPDAVALCRVLAGAGIILANDSAPAHLATAMDKRGVFILGGGHFGMFGPWAKSSRQRWLYHPMDCYGCWWNCIHPAPYCITEISPARVAAALADVLAAA